MLCDDLEGWDGGERERLKRERIYIYMCNYGSFALLYGRNHHNIVKQLSSN